MPTRYQQLRQAIERLAASADQQHTYLEGILGHLAPSGDASRYGNDELALTFGDIYCAVGHMKEWGEITQTEIDAAKPLDTLLRKLSGPEKAGVWKREALWSDPHWDEVRTCARIVLDAFPDERRDSDWMPQTPI
jgi:hypothetical protein